MDEGRNILLLVEGAKTEVKLFKRIIECFPEINFTPDNIIVYNTNIWVLNGKLKERFGTEWWNSEDIDFREYIKAEFPKVKDKKITDIFLVFDYERQDSQFDAKVLENMCSFFDDSVENGRLYINYPMVEAYKHLTNIPLPDNHYKERKCNITDLLNYKSIVGMESKYPDLRKVDKSFFRQGIIHNIRKLSYIRGNSYELTDSEIKSFDEKIDFVKVACRQNEVSLLPDGFVYVLCTCILFVWEYNRTFVL